MADLSAQIKFNLEDIFLYSNVMPKYSDDGITCYGLMINDVLFRNITSLFVLSSPLTLTREERYNVDILSKNYYNTSFLWPILLMLNGVQSVDNLQGNETLYLPPSTQLKEYFSNAIDSSLKTPQLNEPDLSSLQKVARIPRGEETNNTWISNIIVEVLQ